MTDKNMADKIYIEPLTVTMLKKVIEKESPDSILPNLGGQTGLNLAMELEESGFLKEKNVSSYNHLISGAPTSQILSYLVNHQMFDEMQKLADDNGITMTIYVDDVTFSSENRISKDFRDKIITIIRKYNYQISRKKVKRYTKLYPKLVTGVIIDAMGKPVLKNSMRQKIILTYNDLKTNPENTDLRMRLRGLLIAARQVNKDAFHTIYKFAFQPNESIEP
jgi:hypothetical protein